MKDRSLYGLIFHDMQCVNELNSTRLQISYVVLFSIGGKHTVTLLKHCQIKGKLQNWTLPLNFSRLTAWHVERCTYNFGSLKQCV